MEESKDLDSAPNFDDLSPIPPWDQLSIAPPQQENLNPPSLGETLGATAEQALSGATFGFSKVLETKSGLATADEIKEREERLPSALSLGANILGGGATLALTGGLSGLGLKSATSIGRVGIASLEGAGIGALNSANDDWSENKSLDAQKLMANAGIGSIFGLLGGLIGERLAISQAKKAVGKGLTKSPTELQNQANGAVLESEILAGPAVDVPLEKGIKPREFNELLAHNIKAIEAGESVALPAQAELADAAARISLKNPVHPLQLDALSDQFAKTQYGALKETTNEVGRTLSNYEALQKNELVAQIHQLTKSIAPKVKITPDAYKGGQYAIDVLTKQYQRELSELQPILNELRTLPTQGDLFLDSIVQMAKKLPGIADMIEVSEGKIKVKDYLKSFSITEQTYKEVKGVIKALSESKNLNLDKLWNTRSNLGDLPEILQTNKTGAELRQLRAGLMDQMQEASGNPTIRETFKRYAINEQNREVIERVFNASVGKAEFGQISKVKPEMVGDKMFANTATVDAAKRILSPEDFNGILSNWLYENMEKVTDRSKNGFSSNKFNSFLNRNQDALRRAFEDNPAIEQNLRDLITVMRILPDEVSINPSGSAKSFLEMAKNLKISSLTPGGILKAIPEKLIDAWTKEAQMQELNQKLLGQSVKNHQTSAMVDAKEKITKEIGVKVKNIFQSTGSSVRYKNDK